MTSPTSLTWGLSDLDHAIGVPCPGRFVVVGARPSNGKSLWMLNFLNALYAEGNYDLRVLCFWTEATPIVVYKLWAAMRYGYEQDAVLMEEWDRLPIGAEDRMREGLDMLALAQDRISRR